MAFSVSLTTAEEIKIGGRGIGIEKFKKSPDSFE